MTLANEVLATITTLESQLQGFAKAAYANERRIEVLLRDRDQAEKRIAELEAQIAAKPADTDKLREAILALPLPAPTHLPYGLRYSGGDMQQLLELAADTAASIALQAPVREVPTWQQRWKSEYKMLPPVHSNEACLFMEAEIAELRALLPAAPGQKEGE